MDEGIAIQMGVRADANHIDSFRAIAGTVPGGEVFDIGGVAVVLTGLPLAPFNMAFVQTPQSAGHVQEALARLRRRGMPFVLRYAAEGLLPGTPAAAWGLERTADQPGMVLGDARPPRPAPPEMDVIRVRDWPARALFVDVCTRGFGAPPEVIDRLVAPALPGLDDVELYVGCVAGAAVATSALFLNNGVAGIYFVTTVPSHRGRGLGEAMTWHAVRRGRERGAGFASLQASPMGLPVYERMGFEALRSYPSFEQAGAHDATR